MNRPLLRYLLALILLGIVGGFALGMVVAGYTNWECWGDGNYC